jgi:hypothetical protein
MRKMQSNNTIVRSILVPVARSVNFFDETAFLVVCTNHHGFSEAASSKQQFAEFLFAGKV